MNKLKYVLIAVAAILLIVGYFVAHQSQGTDHAQILATIDRGVQGIQSRKLGMIMSCISPNYKDAIGNDYDRLRIFGMQIVRSETIYNVNINTPKIVVRGDDAEASAKVAIATGGGQGSPIFDRQVTLHFKKEPARRLLFYKVPMWKVVSMEDALPTTDIGL